MKEDKLFIAFLVVGILFFATLLFLEKVGG